MFKSFISAACIVSVFFISNSCESSSSQSEAIGESESSNGAQNPNLRNLSDVEAMTLIQEFLRIEQESDEYYGEIEDITLYKGDYNGNNVFDFFYRVEVYPGGDYVYALHYFYDSNADKIVVVEGPSEPKSFYGVYDLEIEPGKIEGTLELFSAFSGEHSVMLEEKGSFTIVEDRIVLNEKSLSALKKLDSELADQIKKLEESVFGDY